jgi:hypothetical protein
MPKHGNHYFFYQILNTMKFKIFHLKSSAAIIFMLAVSLLCQQLKAQVVSGSSCINASGSPTETYTLIPTTGLSDIHWSVAGDIVITDTSTLGQVTIKSQSTQPLPRPGSQGKGRVYASYIVDSNSECGPHIVYTDVYKNFTDTDNIVGPQCVNEGDTVTYSINPVVSVNPDAEIGFDSYKWIVPPAWVSNILYYSADSSSITFTVGTLSGSDSLIVGVGRCNINRGSYTDTLIIGKKLPTPILSYPSCLSVDSTTLTVKWTNPPAGSSYTYQWSKPPNWKIISTSKDSIVLAIDNQPGDVGLEIIGSGSCKSADTTVTINRSLGSQSKISGGTCVIAGSKQDYTVTNVPANTSLKWTIPTGNGWSYNTTDTTAQTISVNVGTVSDTIYVTGLICSGVVDTIVVKLRPANPTTLTGTDSIGVCNTDSLTYTVNATAGANGYGWIFPTGWLPATDTTLGTSVKVKPDGKTSGQVKVYALGGCQNSDTLSLNVAYDTLVPPTIVNHKDCSNIGLNDTATYSISPITDSTFTYGWKLPPGSGWTINYANADSSIIHVISPGNVGTYIIKALSKDTCGGESAYSSDTLNFTGLSYVIVPTVSSPFTSFTVSPNPIPDGVSYQWYNGGVAVPAGNGGNTATIFLFTSSITYPIAVDVTSSEGCITRNSTNGSEGRPDIAAKASVDDTNTIKVSPNPSSGTLNVEFNDALTRNIRLVDSKGAVVFGTTVNNIKNTLDISGVPSGVYFLVATSHEGMVVTRVVVAK